MYEKCKVGACDVVEFYVMYCVMGDDFYVAASDEHKNKERKRARELRQSQWWKQKLAHGICYYCEKKMEKSELTMDHKIPVARGGKSTKGNVVVSCKACNTSKKHLTPAEILILEMSQKNNLS